MTSPAAPPMTSLSLGSAATQQQTSNNGPNSQNLKDDSIEAVMLDFVTSNYTKIKNARKATERQWYINLAFYFGQQNAIMQNTSASASGFRIYVPQAPPWRVRLVVNKIRKAHRKQLATLFGQKPRFDVVPATTDDTDLMAARSAEQLFDWVYDDKNIKEELRRAGWWALICGTAYVKCWWNPKAVDKVNNRLGDFCVDPVTPFNLFVPDFRCMDIEDQPYIIHATTKTKAWVTNNFPMIKNPALTASNDSILDDAYLNMSGTQAMSANEILVLEAWFKPGAHPKLPNGGLVTIVGGQVAPIAMLFPYKHGQYPFAKLENIPSGKFYAHAMLDDLVPLQKEYNRTRSQIVEAKNMMGKLKLLAQQGSVDASKITSEPGQVIFYKPGFNPPSALDLPELPAYVMQQVEQLDADMKEISGQNDPNSQVTSATALSYVQEQDDTLLSDTTDSLESCTEKVGRLILAYVGQYWDTKRLVKVVGTNGEFDAVILLGSDLNNNTDLRVEGGSALPTSKAAKQAFLMDLLKLQLIPPQQGLEMLEIGGIEKVYDEVLADKRAAERENIRMQYGQSLYVNEWDNHALHIQVHNRFRKGQTFDNLPDPARIQFQNHVLMHQAALEQQQQGDPTGSGTELPPANPTGGLNPAEGGNVPQVGGPPNLNAGPPMPSPASISPIGPSGG